METVILLQFYIAFNSSFFTLPEFVEAATKNYSLKYILVESRPKSWKAPLKKPIFLVKLQAAIFLKITSPQEFSKGSV